MYDLKISGGTVVDGTGADRFVGDVAVTDGVIVHVGPSAPGDAARTIDATGLVVTPGFVDCHTHYDGQVTWDDELNPSAGHGVTTVVMGNCGVGFAPVHPGREEWLIQLMEGVEDIPGAALSEGITWGWETFPEYLDVLDQRRLGIDVGTQVPHGAVRAYVMGERGARNEPATPEDIDAMGRIVEEAIEAGALGVSTSRVLGHRAMDGEQVPPPGSRLDASPVRRSRRTGHVRDAPGGRRTEPVARDHGRVTRRNRRRRPTAPPGGSPPVRPPRRLPDPSPVRTTAVLSRTRRPGDRRTDRVPPPPHCSVTNPRRRGRRTRRQAVLGNSGPAPHGAPQDLRPRRPTRLRTRNRTFSGTPGPKHRHRPARSRLRRTL